jgi:hypothetical protein
VRAQRHFHHEAGFGRLRDTWLSVDPSKSRQAHRQPSGDFRIDDENVSQPDLVLYNRDVLSHAIRDVSVIEVADASLGYDQQSKIPVYADEVSWLRHPRCLPALLKRGTVNRQPWTF